MEEIKRLVLLSAKNVFTFKEAALILGLKESYLRKLVTERKISYYKPNGNELRFDRLELESWQKRNKVLTLEEASKNYETNFTSSDKSNKKKMSNINTKQLREKSI